MEDMIYVTVDTFLDQHTTTSCTAHMYYHKTIETSGAFVSAEDQDMEINSFFNELIDHHGKGGFQIVSVNTVSLAGDFRGYLTSITYWVH